MRKLYGLKVKLVIAILISAAITLVFSTITGRLLEKWYFQEQVDISPISTYLNKRVMNDFDKWVRSEGIDLEESYNIDNWIDNYHNAIFNITITQNGEIVYGGDYAYDENLYGAGSEGWYLENELAHHEDTCVRNIPFKNQIATVYLRGYYDYTVYTYLNYGRMLLSFLLFLIIFISLVSKKINYIRQLEKEIKILETGGLDQRITVKGKDELGSLAQNLDAMRQSLMENMAEKEAVTKANNDLVVAVAHDQRTPLTSLILYLEMIQRAPELKDETRTEYLEKASKKAEQIKHMTDALFERFRMEESLKKRQKQVQALIAERPESLWNDILSMFVEDLTDHDFETDCSINWPSGKMSIDVDAVNRILDNISSNIFKYADRESSISLTVSEAQLPDLTASAVQNEKTYFLLKISNRLRKGNYTVESTGQGLKNISEMMEQMHGSVREEKTEGTYSIGLYFELEQ